MALLKDNSLFAYVEGSIGKEITIYRRKNQVIVAKKRGKSRKKPTKNQLLARQKMAEAAAYAKVILADPDIKAYYESKAGPGQNAWNMAIKDAYRAPEVQNIQVQDSTVIVTAKDEFRVAAMQVRVVDAKGTLLEKGNAIIGRNAIDWYYQVSSLPPGGKLIIIAVDLPGNETVREVQLE